MKLIVEMNVQDAKDAIACGALMNLLNSSKEEVSDLIPEEKVNPKPSTKKAPKKKPDVKPEPIPEEVTAPAPKPIPITSAEEPAPIPAPEPVEDIKLEVVQKTAVGLVNAGKMSELQALLAEFEVSAITQLPDDKQVRVAFYNRLKEIEGK